MACNTAQAGPAYITKGSNEACWSILLVRGLAQPDPLGGSPRPVAYSATAEFRRGSPCSFHFDTLHRISQMHLENWILRALRCCIEVQKAVRLVKIPENRPKEAQKRLLECISCLFDPILETNSQRYILFFREWDSEKAFSCLFGRKSPTKGRKSPTWNLHHQF